MFAIQPGREPKEGEMREFRVRVYDDHYLVTNEDVGVGTIPVEKGGLEAALDPQPAKAKRPYPKGTRKRRTKVAEPAAAEVQ